MTEIIKYLKDIRFLVPAFFLVGFEMLMQSGLYRHVLEPKSYADNVNRIVSTVKQSPVDPNVYILGTSVAYQGILLPELNRHLKPYGLTAQSGASEGAKLITQHLIYRQTIPSLAHVDTVIHVSESSYPWTARYDLDPANRSMVAQFPRGDSFELLDRYHYKLSNSDYSHLILRTLTYQQDLRDFILDPLHRLKKLGRKNREGSGLYPYENRYPYSLAAYQPESLEDCVRRASMGEGVPYLNAAGVQVTDIHHRRAVAQTCRLAMKDPMSDPGKEQWAGLFYDRLETFYDELHRDGHRVITAIPPYSRLIEDRHEAYKLRVWKENLAKIHENRPFLLWDLRNTLDSQDNDSLYYDTIHLNRKGAIRFTRILADRIIRNLDGLKK